jgi:NTE family protein
VIRALEGEGFRIRAVAGTSAGGMAGAIYAAGFSPDEIIQRVNGIRQDALFGFGRGPALLGTKGIQQVIGQFLADKQFSDLRLPCALTAVDLKEMKEVVLRQGRVIDAVMATIAIPGVFPPQEWEGLLLVDGMVLDPVPVALARKLAPNLPVVAVSLTPEPERWQIASPWKDVPANPLLRPISRLRVAQAFDIYLRSMDITLHMLGEIRLQVEKPEIIIRPDVSHIGSLDRVDVSEVAELGDQAVRNILPELKKALKRRWWFKR